MNVPPQRTRQLACVATIVTLTALVSLSAARFKTSAASGRANFRVAAATLKGGTVNGGGGSDTLDYSAYTTPVSVNLGLNAVVYQADINAIQETPPNASAALGSAFFSYDNSTHTISGFSLFASGITPAQ